MMELKPDILIHEGLFTIIALFFQTLLMTTEVMLLNVFKKENFKWNVHLPLTCSIQVSYNLLK